MKIFNPQNIGFWVVLVLSFIMFENMCFSANQEFITTLDKQILQVEDVWKAGNTREYYSKVASIARDIMANSAESNLNKVAAKLFDNLISKEAKIKEVGVDDLLVMKKLAYLLLNNNASSEERQINVLLLSKYLGKIRKEIVPNFEPKLVVANVDPPAGTPGAAGMSPKAIHDPIARAQYEASIRENQENGRMNLRQAKLKSIEWEMSKSIIGYIIETFHAGDSTSVFFTECINTAALNDKEKEEVVSKVSSR
jgi:hypothetical protein